MSTRYRLPLRAQQHPWAPGTHLWRSALTVSSPISDDCSSKKRVGAAPVELASESEPLTNKLGSIYTYSQARGPQPVTQSSPSSQSSQSIKSRQYRPPLFTSHPPISVPTKSVQPRDSPDTQSSAHPDRSTQDRPSLTCSSPAPLQPPKPPLNAPFIKPLPSNHHSLIKP